MSISNLTDIELRDMFLQLSVAVTGFDRSMLTGTGLVDQYFRACQRLAGKETINGILENWDPSNPHQFEQDEVDTVKNVVGVWYLGKWMSTGEIISAEAYREALAWSVVHAHPPGAKQPGFGSWKEAPK